MVEIKVRELKTLKERVVGLVGQKEITPVMFETRFGIHTFLLKAPIDVVILDSRKRVVVLKERMPPNRIFFWNPRYKIVLELPSGAIKKYNLKKSSQIQPIAQA